MKSIEDRLAEMEERVRMLELLLDRCGTGLVKKGRASQLPTDWQPRQDDIEWATREYPSIDIRHQTDCFRDYWVSRGSPLKNWNAAWRNWMRKAADYQAVSPASKSTGSRQSPSRVTDAAARNRERGAGALDLLATLRSRTT